MNVRKAQEALDLSDKLNPKTVAKAEGFLQCHELYKPLAEALEYSCPHSSLKCGAACEFEVKKML